MLTPELDAGTVGDVFQIVFTPVKLIHVLLQGQGDKLRGIAPRTAFAEVLVLQHLLGLREVLDELAYQLTLFLSGGEAAVFIPEQFRTLARSYIADQICQMGRTLFAFHVWGDKN